MNSVRPPSDPRLWILFTNFRFFLLMASLSKYFGSKHLRPKAYLTQTFSNRAYMAPCASFELLRACSIHPHPPPHNPLVQCPPKNKFLSWQRSFKMRSAVRTKTGNPPPIDCTLFCLLQILLQFVFVKRCWQHILHTQLQNMTIFIKI